MTHLIINPPRGMIVDHMNHNRLDNRKSNLRICTPTENRQNRIRRGSVGFDKRWNNWRVRIQYQGKEIFLGNFKTELEARMKLAKSIKENGYGTYPTS